MTVLLDGGVLIALAVAEHVHHDRTRSWLAAQIGAFATCPITQGTLVRALLRGGLPVATAVETLGLFVADRRHEFWPDDRPYDAAVLEGVVGHKQVTDAYLASLARAREGRLATLDDGLAVTQADVVDLVPPLPADAGTANGGR